MRQNFDPLTFIPSSESIQKHLAHAEALAKRLRVLLRVAEKIEATVNNETDKPSTKRHAPAALQEFKDRVPTEK
jgi:hypothetical protein